MKRNKIGIILIIIAIIIIIIGLILNFSNILNNKNNNSLDTTKDRIITNTNANIKKEHCLKKLCITKMKISYLDGLGDVTFNLTNKSDSLIVKGYLKIIFTTPSGNIERCLAYDNLNSNEETEIEYEFDEKELTKATDYTIAELTEEEVSIMEENSTSLE